MNPTTLTVIRAATRAGVTPILWGDPGIGKSSLLEAMAAADGLPIEVVIGSIREPGDFAGLPVVADNGEVTLAPPGWAKRLNAAGAGYALLDEITTAPPAVQAAMLRVVLDRWVGDLRLDPAVYVVAAANPPESAADGWDLSPPLANRFLHLELTADADTFITGMTAGWDRVVVNGDSTVPATCAAIRAVSAQVAAYIRTRRDQLHHMPTDDASKGRAWPSPRTWEFVAQVLPRISDDDNDAQMAAVVGLVGEGPGIGFLTWRDRLDLPDPAAVLADPATMDWAADADKVHAVLASVVAHVRTLNTTDAWNAAWGVLAACAERRAEDLAASAAVDLVKTKPDLSLRIPDTGRVFVGFLRAAGLLQALRTP